MKRLIGLAGLAVLLCLGWSEAAPIEGSRAMKVRIPGQSEHDIVAKFAAGERACVIVRGDHNPPVTLQITVHDQDGRVVARDEGEDFAAAIWYPPRDGTYRVQIYNPGFEPREPDEPVYTDCYIAIK